jgi:hypothetical protein
MVSPGKYQLCALEVQGLNVNFLETGFNYQTYLTVAQYSSTNNDSYSNK